MERDNKNVSRQFIANKKDNGTLLKSIKGKNKNSDNWKILENDKHQYTKPFNEFNTWFEKYESNNLLYYNNDRSIVSQSNMNNNPFNHKFFKD